MDDRRNNFRKNPSLFHKIRVIMGSKLNPVQYGITIPRIIAEKFKDYRLVVSTSGNGIIIESGCELYAKQNKDNLVNNYEMVIKNVC